MGEIIEHIKTYLDDKIENVTDASNVHMNPTGRVRVEHFQAGEHGVIVWSIITCLPKDLRNKYQIKLINGKDWFWYLFVDPEFSKALI